MIEFRLPSLGADMDEGKLLEWKVKPGDTVKRGDVIAVVDTSKAAVEVEIWQGGRVQELRVEPGATIPVGTVIAILAEAGEPAAPAAAPAPPKPAVPAPSPAAKPAAAAPPAPPPPQRPPAAPVPAAPAPGLRKAASPAARARARELDVDVERVEGTGPHGAVTIADVERAAAKAEAAVPRAAPPVRAEASVPPAAPSAMGVAERAQQMRKAIAAAMARSKREIPHYYLAETIPMRRAIAWLAQANEGRPVTERLLLGVLQLKAVALALKRYPDLNGFWRDGAFQPGAGIHVGVAVSIRQGGLIAPAIHDVDALPLADLMRALADLVKRTRSWSLRSSELSDPTVTVTNLGEQGVEAVYGVIYPPQVALVGFGRVAERPWAEDGALRAMPVTVATLAGDHRASDGHRGARFLAEVRDLLQRPETL